MAQVDPNIILSAVQQQRSGMSPVSSLKDAITLQSLLQEQQLRRQKLAEQQAAQQKSQRIADLFQQNISPTDSGIQLNEVGLLQGLLKGGFGREALEQQAIFRQREAEEKAALAKASKADLEKAAGIQGAIASAAGAILNASPENRQTVLDSQIDMLIDSGIIGAEQIQSGVIPLVANNESLAILEGYQRSALDAKSQLELAMKERETGQKLAKTEEERQAARDKEIREIQKQKFTQTKDLRKEYTDVSGDFIKQRDAFDRIQASAEDPSAAGDLALIFNYMKVLDPGSTVREGEFANAQNAGGVTDKVYNVYNKVLSGERLSDRQRKDFVGRSGKLFEKAKKNNDKVKKQFVKIAEKNNLDPSQVILDFSENPQTSFNSIEEAEAANLPKGTQITVGGRKAVVE